MNYNQSVDLLTSQGKFYINPDLGRIKALLGLINNPQDKLKIIHTAGTNGKGSVCAAGANILKCAGYKTGLYTSPHLFEYTERIKINDEEISKEDFAKYVSFICCEADKNNIELTEFEILTACAFKYFFDNKTDYVFLEAGLGGRFDATNVIEKNEVSVITSISLDHTDRLGSSTDEIAFEKAGIIKKNSPVIVCRDNLGFNVIKSQAERIGANVIEADNNVEICNDYALIDGKRCESGLKGIYQSQNLAIVIKLAEYLKNNGCLISSSALMEGLKTVKWRARFEYNKEKNIIIDGAHNPDAVLKLKESLDKYFGRQKRIYIYSTLSTKDYKKIAQILFDKDDEIYYYEFKHKNAVSYKDYLKTVDWLAGIKPFDESALYGKELKVVTGSLYMIGEFVKRYIYIG